MNVDGKTQNVGGEEINEVVGVMNLGGAMNASL